VLFSHFQSATLPRFLGQTIIRIFMVPSARCISRATTFGFLAGATIYRLRALFLVTTMHCDLPIRKAIGEEFGDFRGGSIHGVAAFHSLTIATELRLAGEAITALCTQQLVVRSLFSTRASIERQYRGRED
jgi:hypothetical protein